jgi:diguanylate cyclase (GGDEF)-like protein/PAS domain S-box-containing protein
MEASAPELRNMAEAYNAPNGVLCEGHRVFISPSTKIEAFEPKVLAFTIVKLSPRRGMITISDVSRQVAQERRLKQAETWFASLIDGIKEFGFLSLDANGRIDSANASVTRQTGYNEANLLGCALDIFDAPESTAGTLNIPDQIALAGRDGWHLHEGWHQRLSGERYWCQRLIAVRNEALENGEAHITGYTAILREVLRQEFDTVKLIQMLRTDHLTGAFNRAHFFEAGEREVARYARQHEPLSLIALDVDHFKAVNDTYGHAGGDAVLKALTKTCTSLLRSVDTFGRLGGEEFCILLPSTDLLGAYLLAERLRTAIAATSIPLRGMGVHVTASFGCAGMGGQVGSLSELMAVADAMLYEAKRSGRDCVIIPDPARALLKALA